MSHEFARAREEDLKLAARDETSNNAVALKEWLDSRAG